MQNKLIIFLFSILFISLAAETKAQSKNTTTAVIKTNIYCDHCLECNDCGGKLVHDLSFVKGIKRNAVDPKAMTITVTYNPKQITLEGIQKEISKLGYDADSVKADVSAYAKLDGCCKKPE